MASDSPDRFRKQDLGLVVNSPNVIGQFFCHTQQNVQKVCCRRVLETTIPSMKLTRLQFHVVTSIEELRLIQPGGRLGDQSEYHMLYTVCTHAMSARITLIDNGSCYAGFWFKSKGMLQSRDA